MNEQQIKKLILRDGDFIRVTVDVKISDDRIMRHGFTVPVCYARYQLESGASESISLLIPDDAIVSVDRVTQESDAIEAKAAVEGRPMDDRDHIEAHMTCGYWADSRRAGTEDAPIHILALCYLESQEDLQCVQKQRDDLAKQLGAATRKIWEFERQADTTHRDHLAMNLLRESGREYTVFEGRDAWWCQHSESACKPCGRDADPSKAIIEALGTVKP